jgi:hypothetical protein
MSTTTNMAIGAEGLCVRRTAATAAALRRFTSTQASSSKPSKTSKSLGTPPEEEDLSAEARRYVDAEAVPFRLLKRVCEVGLAQAECS